MIIGIPVLIKKLREPLANLLGARFDEVVVMNSLTINLHLLLTSFYQPTTRRFKIMMEAPTFPSDLYAIRSHLLNHGLNPEDSLIIIEPRKNEILIRNENILNVIKNEGESIALVYINPVNYLTGQVLNIDSIAKTAREYGCIIGLDLAHSAGNIPLELHQNQIDFAVGCSYKYLCSGPGGPGFAFVHQAHHHKILPRLSGWWGNNPDTRFNMNTEKIFIPYGGAYSWQVSTPSILVMVPMVAAMEIFNDTNILAMRKKSILQTTYLLELLNQFQDKFSIVTPLTPEERGCQISICVDEAEIVVKQLLKNNVICDYRPPNIIRITPSPLYNSFEEIDKLANIVMAACCRVD